MIALVLSVIVYAGYDLAQGGYQFVERMPWLPALGISYYVGVNGISVPLVLLGALVVSAGVMISWKVEDRPREFFSFLMFLGASVQGVFCSLDLFMLFFFFELAVFPKYLMIAIWGSPKTRDYGAMKLTLYLFIGSVISLVGVLAMYFAAGQKTFDMLALEKAGFSLAFQQIWFPVVFLRLCRAGRHFPLPLLGAGWPRGRADRHLDAAGGRGNESGRICRAARGDHAAAGRRALLGPADPDPGDDQRGLRRVHRHDPDRFQICHRFFLGFAHGAGADRFCHPHPARGCSARACRCSRTAS